MTAERYLMSAKGAAGALAARRRAVHAACRQLGMDDETRRDMLQGQVGVRSTTQLDLVACDKVLNHLRACGAAKGTKVGHKGAPTKLGRVPQLQKIEALLADMGLPWSYADKIAAQVTGGANPKSIKRMGWVTESKHLTAVIVALTIRQKKLEKEARLAEEALRASAQE